MFTSNKLLVVVAELRGDERDALDMVPVVTTALLEEHQLVTGIVVIVDPGEWAELAEWAELEPCVVCLQFNP